MRLEANSKLVMIGDSITDCGRNQPIGEAPRGGLGFGYVAFVDGLLQALYPDRPIRVVNVGTSGNTVVDLQERWQRDVIDQRPDYVSVMIGVNDVWRQFDSRLLYENHVSLDRYRETLRSLVTKTLPRVKEMFLLSPFFLELNRSDPMRAMVDAYADSMKTVAEETGATFIDIQAEFDERLQHLTTWSWSGDRVHPYVSGHMVIARAFLREIGVQC
ncbi:lysophospholipase L1-like esterase [Alicyclobacillus sacchari]|uniref:Lysophospholipase L1-like esterase n=1 Tax=Alicyclobacillus sacchari TaxID=392010 RepID=A0A4R8LL60_9BACL|nr:SGNH/GDSL hydrolase family protein [Alicyclobacillus sacchari]TDY45272.1 lysophospholipase L1-like esterase [Alicyclobacillus sacchari]GMA56888.1 lipase [Alicyclobacillus sacchari]